MARLGWQMDERTRSRYETGKEEGYISAMSAAQHAYETEEIFHEEDPLRVLRRLEAEGWMKHLNPTVASNKANVTELERLRDVQMQLQIHGIHADATAANFPLLTAKMAPKDVAALKKSFLRQTFVDDINALEAEGKAFGAQLSGKEAAAPSQAWKLLHSGRPEAILWAAHHVKAAGVQNKLKSFYTDWPQARQRIPYTVMQEMRITPDLPVYDELVEKLFFQMMDNKLSTVEEQKAFLEPYSPPAPPPPVHLRRARATRKEAKPPKSRKKAAVEGEVVDAAAVAAGAKATTEKAAAGTTEKAASGKKPAVAAKVPAKAAAPVKAAVPAKKVATAVKKAAAPVAAKKAVAKAPAKKAPAKKPAPVKKAVKKAVAKPAAKKAVPAKKAVAKPVVKKVAPKKVAAKAPAKKVAAKKAPAKAAKKKR
jgi:hypothetical protein